MSLQEEKPRTIEVSYQDYQDEASVIDSIADAPTPHSSTARIHKVPQMVKETQEYGKYYIPKAVSIGPYHFGNPKLKMVEEVKPCFTMKLLMNNKEALKSLYKKLGNAEMLKELRNYYEEKSTDQFSDKVFTKMMLLDGCFILYYIKFIIFGEKLQTCQELKSHQIVFIHQDMFLLENQIPFKVLNEVMNLMNDADYCYKKIKLFISENILARERPNTRWTCFRHDQSSGEEAKMELINKNSDHLLHLLHHSLTKKHNTPENDFKQTMINRCINFIGGIHLTSRNNRYTFRNVNELMDVGIDFKLSSSMSLAHIEVFKSWWFFSANVELPPITVDDSTKPMLLNLVAYEMCSWDAHESWVTSYICLLDFLIDHPDDVKTLRKAGVLDNSLGSDEEVAKLFNEIGTDLVPNTLAYLEAKNKIQRHYESWRNTLFSQLKREYVKSPWAFLALLGALVALVLSGAQAYFSVWSPKSQCDDLCLFLKNNHHL